MHRADEKDTARLRLPGGDLEKPLPEKSRKNETPRPHVPGFYHPLVLERKDKDAARLDGVPLLPAAAEIPFPVEKPFPIAPGDADPLAKDGAGNILEEEDAGEGGRKIGEILAHVEMVDLDEVEAMQRRQIAKLPSHPEGIGGDHGVGMAEKPGEPPETAEPSPQSRNHADRAADLPDLGEKWLFLIPDEGEKVNLVGAGEMA
jgi:hypothetical protein